MRKIVYCILCLILVACQVERPEVEITLHRCAPIPEARVSAVCFVAGEEAYIFGGRDSLGRVKNDLWRYTPAKDQWENLGTTPLMPRVNAAACVADEKVYIGLGFHGRHGQDSSYLRDWWEYSPQTNQWKQLADYPNYYTDDATTFVGDGELYVGYGFCWNYRRDMFRYDIAADRWDSIDVGVGPYDFPTRSFGGTGCTCQGRHFRGTGYYRFSLDWWGELVDGKRWEPRKAVPGKARTLAATTATERYIYLSGGIHYGGVNTTGEVLRDIRRYTPETDEWTYIGSLPEGMLNHISFAIGKQVYIGLGEGEEWNASRYLYRFEE